MAFEADKGRRAAPAGPRAALLADRRDGADLWGATQAMRPLAELCLSADAETPFALGLVGGPGAGKTFALRRLVEAAEARARAGGPGLLAKIVVARVDVGAGDPASAVAAAVFGALESDYAALADEAAQATVDPRHAAAAAGERHDDIVSRLEQERCARDEAEARRARLSEALLRETPGSRIDAFIRTSRSSIESKLRRFGFDGDAGLSFRSLVGDLAGARAPSRLGLFLRAMWAYGGQTRLIVLALLAFALALATDRLRLRAVQYWLTGLSAEAQTAVDWVKAHDDRLHYASEALIAVGVAALVVNVLRAAGFTRLLFQGLRMLDLDVQERRRELDASAARLERRVASLQIEADAAGRQAEELARRAGGAQGPSRPQGPSFLGAEGPARAARAFLDDLGRAMDASVTPTPQRVLILIDGLDALASAEARRFLETATRLAGRGFAVIAAVDLTRFGATREIAEALFDVVYDITPATGTVAPWLLPPPASPEAKVLELAGPLDETETGFLKAASALVGAQPRALKRFYNAYRLARLSDAPRGALALSLAALMAPNPDAAAALCSAFSGEGEFTAPPGPPALKAAFERLGVQGMGKDAARRAFAAARRYAPWG